MKSLPLETHQDIGIELKKIRTTLIELYVLLGNTCGRSTKGYKLALKSYNSVNALRCELDNVMFAEHRDKANASTYYGPNQ